MDEIGVKGQYTLAEEIAHAITHGLGLVLSVAALAILVVLASLFGDAWHIVSVSIYGSTLVLLYAASTFYHALPAPQAKSALQVVDRACIYLLIAGTYTPFTLVNLRGGWGWTLFGVVWGLALVGVGMEAFARQFARSISLALYIAIGWAAAIAVKPVFASVDPGGLALLLAGGVAYTGGVVFYCWRSLPYNHAIWHVFVVAGSVLQFFAVLLYVLPGRGA